MIYNELALLFGIFTGAKVVKHNTGFIKKLKKSEMRPQACFFGKRNIYVNTFRFGEKSYFCRNKNIALWKRKQRSASLPLRNT